MEVKLKHEHPMADWILQNVPSPLSLLFEKMFWDRVNDYKPHYDQTLRYMTDVVDPDTITPYEILEYAFVWKDLPVKDGFDKMECICLWLNQLKKTSDEIVKLTEARNAIMSMMPFNYTYNAGNKSLDPSLDTKGSYNFFLMDDLKPIKVVVE